MLAAESACLPFQCILEQTLQVSDSFALLPDRQPERSHHKLALNCISLHLSPADVYSFRQLFCIACLIAPESSVQKSPWACNAHHDIRCRLDHFCFAVFQHCACNNYWACEPSKADLAAQQVLGQPKQLMWCWDLPALPPHQLYVRKHCQMLR